MGIFRGIKHLAKDVGKAFVDGGKDVGKAVEDGGKAASDASVAAWEASSKEASAIGNAIESTGLTLTEGIIDGGKTAESWLTTGAEYTGNGLISLGKYLTQHACDIAVGSALSAVVATYTLDGEEEAGLSSLAVICAKQTMDNAVLTTEAKAIAFVIAEPIWIIPGVSDAVKNKNLLIAVIAFAIFKCCKENPKSTVGTGGQIVIGVLLTCLTSFICEGALPGGFEPWRKANF